MNSPHKLIKSPLNYSGGKYRLLPQLLPLFPSNIKTFHDIFCGGANVAVNVMNICENVVATDINQHVIQLFECFQKHGFETIKKRIKQIVEHYSLSRSTLHGYDYYQCNSSHGLSSFNKTSFLQMRNDFNSGNGLFDENVMFFVLLIFGFNNQIRFNSQGKFNMPCGKRDFNERIQQNLREFCDCVQNKRILFECKSFVDVTVEKDDFIYADPPYLISTASYNEQNGWNEELERKLLSYLLKNHENGNRFALSNIMEHKGKTNDVLLKWIETNRFKVHELRFNYDNSSYHKKEIGTTREVLVVNY